MNKKCKLKTFPTTKLSLIKISMGSHIRSTFMGPNHYLQSDTYQCTTKFPFPQYKWSSQFSPTFNRSSASAVKFIHDIFNYWSSKNKTSVGWTTNKICRLEWNTLKINQSDISYIKKIVRALTSMMSKWCISFQLSAKCTFK